MRTAVKSKLGSKSGGNRLIHLFNTLTNSRIKNKCTAPPTISTPHCCLALSISSFSFRHDVFLQMKMWPLPSSNCTSKPTRGDAKHQAHRPPQRRPTLRGAAPPAESAARGSSRDRERSRRGGILGQTLWHDGMAVSRLLPYLKCDPPTHIYI